ncbi:MAG: ABC transporter permease [Anaerolineae bacterium]|nr:ABC transporter permease [Anaerolineae bacterium]
MTPLLRRSLSLIVTVWFATTLAFIGLRLLPGDAITSQLRQVGVGSAAIEERRAQQGLDDPILIQYLRYMGNLVRGQLGYSLLSGEPISEMVIRDLRPTVVLSLSSLLIGSGLGIALGVSSGLAQHTSFFSRTIVNLALSTPVYWTGTLAIFTFTAQLGLLPSAGAGRLSQLVLPVAVLSFHTAGPIARVVATHIADMKSADFVRTARGKGLKERTILFHHILRTGLLPVVSVIALQAGFLFSGTVIVETLFVRPGIGRLLLNATIQQDYPIVQGVVVLSAIVYATMNMIADVLHRLLDPRIRI